MGSRLSRPRAPGGTTELTSHTSKSPYPRSRTLNSRHFVAPAAAATMALLLFVYARTSIRAAKTNARRHREADSGGEGVNLLAESRRRHGQGPRVEAEGGTVRQLAKGAKEQLLGKEKVVKGKVEATGEEERLKAAMGRRKGND